MACPHLITSLIGDLPAMTEDTLNDDNTPVEDELKSLKAKAKLMGIKFHPSSGIDSLREKIAAAVDSDEPTPVSTPATGGKESETAMRLRVKREATKLVRVRIACMNPNKKDWDGEIFTTGNSVIPTMKKMVPFNVDFHVPQMILTMIEQRFCQVFSTVTDPVTRIKRNEGKLVKEFAIEILADLTAGEMKDLAQRQAMAAGTAA